jgi:hypothetical protein
VEHGEVRVLSNLPAHKNSAESIHPTVRAFDNPASRFHAGLALQFLLLFASASQMQRETRRDSDGAGFGVVVALVETGYSGALATLASMTFVKPRPAPS